MSASVSPPRAHPGAPSDSGLGSRGAGGGTAGAGTGATAWLRRVDPCLPRALGLVAALRVGLGLEGFLVTALRPGDPSAVTWQGLRLPTSGLTGALLAPWQRDDALWYQRIAERGYGHDPSAAFMPLYPGLVHLLSVAAGAATVATAMLVSTVAMVVALVLLHRLVRTDLGAAVADRTLLYLAIAPTAFFLLAPYTESLFLALAVGTVLAARRDRFALAAVLAALAAACRLQGVLLVVPVAVELVSARRTGRLRGPRRLGVAGLTVVLPAVTLGLVELLVRHDLGFAGGSFEVERNYWGNHEALPWTVLGDSVRTILGGGHQEELFNLLAIVAALAALPLMWRRLPASYTALTAAMVLPLLLRENHYTPLMSAVRFCLVIFPLFVLLAQLGGSARVHRVVVTVFPALLLLFFANAVRYHLVG